MLYSEFLNTVNERIRQGKFFSKIQYTDGYSTTFIRDEWRDYIMFLQPKEYPIQCDNFSPMFSVLLDGSGRSEEEEYRRGGLGLSGIQTIEDLTVEDYADFARCLKSRGLKFNRKLKTLVKDD